MIAHNLTLVTLVCADSNDMSIIVTQTNYDTSDIYVFTHK